MIVISSRLCMTTPNWCSRRLLRHTTTAGKPRCSTAVGSRPNSDMRTQKHTTCALTSLQAEKLRSSSLSQELCILSVIEILYLWKALPNCSAGKLQAMTQGKGRFETARVAVKRKACLVAPGAVHWPCFPLQSCRGSTTPPAQASSICCSVPFTNVCSIPKKPSRYSPTGPRHGAHSEAFMLRWCLWD